MPNNNPNRQFTDAEEIINALAAVVIRNVTGVESEASDDLAELAVHEELEPAVRKLCALRQTDYGIMSACLGDGFTLGLRVAVAVSENAFRAQERVSEALEIAKEGLARAHDHYLAEQAMLARRAASA